MPSVHDCLLDQLLDLLAVVDPAGPRLLGHEDGDELLLRLDPEEGAAVAGPHELALRARHPGDARRLPDHEAEPEGIARRARQHLARPCSISWPNTCPILAR